MPRVSVLMAVYNGECYLREAVESILQQTYQDFEFLIVNDDSTDRTRDILLSYRDPRIRLIDNSQNLGLARSLNLALEQAVGEFVARQDADDISEPKRLARQVKFMDEHPEIALLGTWYREIDSEGNTGIKKRLPCRSDELLWSLLFYCPFVHSAVLLRRSVLEEVGFYDPALSYSLDYELWLRISRLRPIANLNEYLVRYRMSPYSMTATLGEKVQEGFRIRVENLSYLLGWEKEQTIENEQKLTKMYHVLFSAPTRLELREIDSIEKEIFHLHAAFCRSSGLEKIDCQIHRTKLLRKLSRRYMEFANRLYGQVGRNGSRNLVSRAYHLDWSGLFTIHTLLFLIKFLLAPRVNSAA